MSKRAKCTHHATSGLEMCFSLLYTFKGELSFPHSRSIWSFQKSVSSTTEYFKHPLFPKAQNQQRVSVTRRRSLREQLRLIVVTAGNRVVTIVVTATADPVISVTVALASLGLGLIPPSSRKRIMIK
ncbi:hypothetical protein J6590_032633 [Homalodisca vitripennis]|nr:hypothetical protein J6590_032633 [Homalodisca vitripennis]